MASSITVPAVPPIVTAARAPVVKTPPAVPVPDTKAVVAAPETKAVGAAAPGLDLDRLAKALTAAPGVIPAARSVPPPAAPPPVAVAPPAEAVPPSRTVVIEPPRVIEAPKLAPPPALAAPPPRPKLPAQRTSFDCASATSATQDLICHDPALAQADRQLALAYDAAMASTPDRAALHEDQQRWFADRDRLGADRAAVAAIYQSRITELAVQTREDRRKGGLLRRR
jgi:uncharacterized protein YecT (DUF1311 family)